MRKQSRAMDSAWALEVMRKAPYITVSFIDADGIDAIKAHPEVCLSAVTKCAPTIGPKDGSFTLQYKSAIAFGKAELVEDDTEKIHALRIICERFLPQHMDAFDASIQRSLSRTAVIRITLSAPPTGKRKQYDSNGDEMKGTESHPSTT